MKIVQINKVKVRIFEEEDLKEKLNMSAENCDIVLTYQREFPELLQDNIQDFIIEGEKLWNKLGNPQGEYSKWFKRKIEPFFKENVDYTMVDKLVVNGNSVKRQMLSLETAKHLSLMTGGDKNSKEEIQEKGKLIRKYFMVMEQTLRDFEKWEATREPEKQEYNVMIEELRNWCIRSNYEIDDKIFKSFRVRESNMINQNLTGKIASEIKTHIGYKDNITRDHLDEKLNSAILDLQKLNTNLLIANMDFETRNNLIKSVCITKYSDLFLK